MKLAIVTQPLFDNYGGILQCYALQTVLQRMGHEVVVLNRRGPKERLSLWLFLLRCVSVIKCIIRRYILGQKQWAIIKPWATWYVPDKRQRKTSAHRKFLRQFIYEHFHQSSPLTSTDDMARWANTHPCDAFVVGSDQVWRGAYNADVTESFCSFLPDTDPRRRIVYAASFGTEYVDISPEKLPECRRLAQFFSAVSIREQSAIRLAKEALGIEPQWVLDPTMLLTADDYRSLWQHEESQWEGITTYVLDASEEKSQIQHDVAQTLSLPVNALMLPPIDQDGKPVDMIPVEAWLKAFAQASFVITDSFHGCVFSIIHRKPFIAIANRERGIDRFTSLLGYFGLMDRLIFSLEEYQQKRSSLLTPIDYVPIVQKHEEARTASLTFLREALAER
ncbi:MAG: polysaccharide pyruvyl transferase family protein [Paraprevotella sp.]|nr:polysaccharide pyruvyl transferase family protein [Paraprevotella sp.]